MMLVGGGLSCVLIFTSANDNRSEHFVRDEPERTQVFERLGTPKTAPTERDHTAPTAQALDSFSVKHVASVCRTQSGHFLKGRQPDDWR